MPHSKRYLYYFRKIPSDKWLYIKDYAPNNPERFIHYLEMLPFAGYDLDKKTGQFRIIGKL